MRAAAHQASPNPNPTPTPNPNPTPTPTPTPNPNPNQVYRRETPAEAVAHEGVVLGAYCGMNMKDADVASWFDALFEHARKADLPVDLHIDETNDVSGGCSLLAAAKSLAAARARRFPTFHVHATPAYGWSVADY